MGKQGAFYCLCKSIDRAEDELSGILRCVFREKCSCHRKNLEQDDCGCKPKCKCYDEKNCGILP